MLKPNTEQVWTFLKGQPLLTGFVLLGGSALALHLHHRYSEDLDLAYPGAALPRAPLEGLRRLADETGMDMRPDDDPGAVHEFSNGGLDLHDYQQNFIVSGTVKVTFFAPERPHLALLRSETSSSGVRIATLDELFESKSILSASRSKTRDWFDLYILMTRCGYTMTRFHEAFKKAGISSQASIALQRICGGPPQASDEAFETLAPGAPSIKEMQDYFTAQRDAFERSEAARILRESRGQI